MHVTKLTHKASGATTYGSASRAFVEFIKQINAQDYYPRTSGYIAKNILPSLRLDKVLGGYWCIDIKFFIRVSLGWLTTHNHEYIRYWCIIPVTPEALQRRPTSDAMSTT